MGRRTMTKAVFVPLCLATLASAQQGPLPVDGNPALQTDMVGVVPSFEFVLGDKLELDAPVSGRLTLYMIDDNGSGIGKGMKPANGPFWDNLQPMYAVDVTDFKQGDVITIDASSMGWPCPLDKLEEGVYRVQAVLNCVDQGSDWVVEEGNLFSDAWFAYLPGEDGVIPASVLQAVKREIKFPQQIPIERRTKPRNYAALEGLSFKTVPSRILSEATGTEVTLKAGILSPTIYRRQREYPTIYQIPAYGEDHTAAWKMSRLRTQMPGFNTKLYRAAYRVLIGADGPWGHNLLADSDLNGPVLEAIVKELIPAIEADYPVIAEPGARILWGASSGG
ncbi:MAG: hypothetical protein KDA21_08495, partial [Phycisphaerales bacterium]|nr:hypothetical protein [Phycisphaerales bacterium]